MSWAHEYLVLDASGCVLAASGGKLARSALAGLPLCDHDGTCLPGGLVAAISEAIVRARATRSTETTGVFAVPALSQEVRAEVTPAFSQTNALHSIVVTFEQVAPKNDDKDRALELERANEELLRVIAEQLKTERALQRSQEQLHHAQRLEAVGRLAGGIAHDFNNLLSVVLGYSISIANGLPEDAPLRADLDEIRRAGERAAELTQQLLAFGRKQVLEPRVLDLNEVMVRVDRMVRRLVGADVEVATRAAPSLWKVKVDPGQIEQVILNLVINARDAMPDGGRLTLETENVEFDEDYAQAHAGASPGPHVMLAVTDNGIGMDKDTMGRVFEPFFTTKEKGKGTGLGLSTVFGIVRQSGGHIFLYSELGKGTTFKLFFPRTTDPSEAPRAGRAPSAAPSGDETILLVEDDTQLRTLARTILVRQGYEVLEAAGPAQALEVGKRHAGEIQLLLTDIVMPQMNGRELARRLHESRPKTRVLYMSGYTDNAIVHNGILDSGIAFLQKPITPDVLARKVREVLDDDEHGV